MNESSERMVINKRGKIVKKKDHPVKQIVIILIICFALWLIMSILITIISWRVLTSYESTDEMYSMVSTVLSNAVEFSNSIISGTITGIIAFVGVWWTIKDAREINNKEKGLDIMPSLEPMFTVGVGYDLEHDNCPYIRFESAFCYEQMDAVLKDTPVGIDEIMDEEETLEWLKQSFITDWKIYQRQKFSHTKESNDRITIRRNNKSLRECALSKESLFADAGDACFVMEIYNRGKGDAYLERIICEESGQIWNCKKHIRTGKFGYEDINVVVHCDICRKICIGFEFRDERGTLYYQRADFYVFAVCNNRFFKEKRGERVIERYYANVEQPIMILE